MTAAQSAAAPWLIRTRYVGYDRHVCADIVSGNNRLATILHGAGDWSSASHEERATATLMAQAPELLAALREVILHLRGAGEPSGKIACAVSAAETAILNAEYTHPDD